MKQDQKPSERTQELYEEKYHEGPCKHTRDFWAILAYLDEQAEKKTSAECTNSECSVCPVKKEKWRAEIGEKYWIISSTGEVSECPEQGWVCDFSAWLVGNYFRTQLQAHEAAEVIKAALKQFNEGI